MTFRVASQDDCADIASIYNHYLGKSTMDLEVKDESYYQRIIKHQDSMEELWVTDSAQITAWGIIKKYSDRKGYQYAGETSVYCHPDHLHRGIGTSLKKHLMARCANLGYHHLLARIFSENEISINYNLKLGYTIVGTQKEIGHIHGQWKDVTIMQYIIT